RSLEGQLLAGLCSRYPAAALARFELDPEASLKTCYSYARAVSSLAKKDPAAAAAWVDRIVSDGPDKEKQGYGPTLLKASLIEGLLQSDEAEASRRLAACPEKERADLLSQMHPSSEQTPAYIALLRESVPAGQVPKSLVNAIYPLLWSGSEPVSKMLDDMAASPQERLAVAEKMTEYPFGSVSYTREVRVDEVTSLHDWFALQAPGKENELMGQSLGKLLSGGSEDFTRIAAMVTKYDADGSGGMLIPFLSGLPPSLSEDATPLIERIADPAKREEIRSRFQK
ncbi:MAG: hypothetical protein JWO82_3733, partial [Akkermansiaceae bacterium]|nr:hypothetical protein [Akkermansiaceae bacterium]